MATRPQNVGIKAVEIYFPRQCVDQSELEKFDGVGSGKYTIGFGQTKMSFCDDREDMYSLALTTLSSLFKKYSIDPKTIGRLEVGTESMLDKSKSVKSICMQLFEKAGNFNVEGVDTMNACYGGTNAVFNSINWVESSAWDGRNAVVIAGDIALYQKGNARPTGGAGCVAMLIGPDAPLVFEPGMRGTYIRHAYDFYKPDLASEYPVVDGQMSLQCYTEAVDACYRAYNAREDARKTQMNGSVNGNGVAPEAESKTPLDRFDYFTFHAPNCKLVTKSYARLLYNDFLADPSHPLFKDVAPELRDLGYQASLTDKGVEKTFMGLSKKKFAERVQPAIEVPTMCGNMYCGSVWGGLVSIVCNVAPKTLQGKRIGVFSYGSGLASSMLSLRVVGDTSEMVEKVDLQRRLGARKTVPPQVYDEHRNTKSTSHSRHTSSSSFFSSDSSPDSILSQITTPSRSPVHQYGPTLLPKIRTQDAGMEPSATAGPKRSVHRRVLSSTCNPPTFQPCSTTRPQVQRSVTEPVECTTTSPISVESFKSNRGQSLLNSPVTFTGSHSRKASVSHSRSSSTSGIDQATLRRYGYPNYRLPVYATHGCQAEPTDSFASYTQFFQDPIMQIPGFPQIDTSFLSDEHQDVFPQQSFSYSRTPSLTPPPNISTSVSPIAPTAGSVPATRLLTYLTMPTQPINLVRNLTFHPTRGTQNHFWWDVRNLRSWESFSIDTIASIPGLQRLLTIDVDSTALPDAHSFSKTLQPESEGALTELLSKSFFPRVNTAVALSQGSSSMSLYTTPLSGVAHAHNHPSFLANYGHDAAQTINGLPRGRLVGICKSFDRWNTGMRHEAPHRKVEYLAGLAHLQKCMRDHSCRYGFILTEIELVCVRAGCDEGSDVPYFGYLEVSEAIPTNRHVKPNGFSMSFDEIDADEIPLTASLALYYLLMLSKTTPLPSQSSGFMDVGGPGALMRQRVWHAQDVPGHERGKEGRDKWIPEPNMGEKRDAKRVRGWVWPADPWSRREGGVGSKRR
ncbi:MAG: hypothetical protein Q9227_003535 [Pyrenula ochraceoflavens]